MRSARIGILAIPVIIGLIAFSSTCQACAGGISNNDHDRMLFSDNVTASPENYTARVFVINDSAPRVSIRGEEGVRVYVLNDEEMGNFTSGRPFTSRYNSTIHSNYIRYLEPGKYWFVVDNRGHQDQTFASIEVMHMAPREAQTNCIERPFFVPDVSSGFVALAMVLATVMSVLLKKR